MASYLSNLLPVFLISRSARYAHEASKEPFLLGDHCVDSRFVVELSFASSDVEADEILDFV